MPFGHGEVSELCAAMRTAIDQRKATVAESAARLARKRVRLIAHFEQMDAHLAHVHGFLAEHYHDLRWEPLGTGLRDGYAVAVGSGTGSADEDERPAPTSGGTGGSGAVQGDAVPGGGDGATVPPE